MSFIYNIIISIYYFLIALNSIFNSKSNEWLRGRKSLWTDLEIKTKNIKNIVWFHCASYGEYEQAKELIKSVSIS